MKAEGRVTRFSSGCKHTEVNAVFPEGTAIAKGDKCYICGKGVEGIVRYASVDKLCYKDNGVRATVEFPVGTRVSQGMKVSLPQPACAEPVAEGLPCAGANGCLLRVGYEYYPARDILSISSCDEFGTYISFRDGRTAKHVRVEDPEVIVRAWETALSAPA